MKTISLRALAVPAIRLGAILGQLAYVKIYSRHLSNHELGIYFYLMTSSYFLNALVFVPVDYYQQSRIYSFRADGISLTTFLRFNRTLLLLIGVITLALLLPCLFISRIAALDAILCVFMAVALYVTTAYKNLLNNLDHKLVVAAVFLVEVVLKTGLFFLAMLFLPPRAIFLLGSNVLALSAILALLAWVARGRGVFGDGSASQVDYREVARFSFPLSIAAIANWLQSQGYRLVLVPLGYTELVGIYATVANIGITAMNAGSVLFGQLYAPRLYQTQGYYLRTYLRNALLLIFLVFVVGALFSEGLIPLLTRHDLGRYSRLMLYGIGTEAGNFLVGGLAIYMTIKNKTHVIMNSSFLGAAVVVVSIFLLYFSGRAGVYTIGIPIVLSQAAVVAYLFASWKRQPDA